MNDSLAIFLGVFGLSALVATVLSARKAQASSNFFGASHPVGRFFQVGDFLVSSDFPAIRQYRLTLPEFQNLERLVAKLDLLVPEYGKPTIRSGGRPKSVGDFHAALEKRGLKPAKQSQHTYFSAVDATWGDEKNHRIFQNEAPLLFLQSVLYFKKGKADFLHLSVPNPELPGVKPYHDTREL